METQYWLAELDPYGNPSLVDGAHSTPAGAEKALTIRQKLDCVQTEGRKYAIAKVILTEPTGEHESIDETIANFINAKRT